MDVYKASTDESVPRQVRRGISWNVVGAISTNAMRLLVVVVLGRVLDSHDFGVVAAALSVIAILHTVRDIGIGPALVQRKHVDDGHIAAAFAVSTYLGLGLAALVVVSAPLIGALYHTPECVDLLRALGVLFAMRGLATTSQALCQRAMNFRAVALIDTVAYSAGSLTAMVLAIAGFGPWSLAAGYLVEEATSAAAFLTSYRPRVAFRIDRGRLRDLLGFGAGQLIYQVVNMVAVQGDNFVVGNRLGTSALGFYARAYDLIKLPAAVFQNIVANVLFPAFARLQGDPDRMGIGFRRLVFANALVILPASAVLIAVAPEAIRILMGPGWGHAVLPFQILAVSMLMRVSYKVGAVISTANGAVYAVASVNAIYAALVVGGALLTVRWGIAGVAASTAVSLVVMYVMCTYLGMQHCSLRWRGFAAAHGPGLMLGAVSGLVAWPIAEVLRGAGVPAVATLAVVGAVGSAITIAIIAFWVKRGRGDFEWLATEIGGIKAKLLRRRRLR